MLLTISPMPLKAGTETTTASRVLTESAEAKVLLSRLEVINAMDKSKLSSPERKQLRKEVRGIKSHLKDLGHGVYLSVGAIIIILLLLIILL